MNRLLTWSTTMYYLICREDLPEECVAECSAAGDVGGAVAYWVTSPQVKAILARIPDDVIRQCIKGCGAWDADQLGDADDNRERILWLACCQINEGDDYFVGE